MSRHSLTAGVVLLVIAAGCSGAPRAPVGAPGGRVPAGRPGPVAAAEAASARPSVDALVRASWRAAGITPAPLAGDAEYLRRVTLDLTGRLPSLDQARAFLADRNPRKREHLVDELLASPAYAEHFADVYGDLLFGREARLRGPFANGPVRTFLVEAFARNRPWDRLSHELLTASGELAEDGAVAYVARHALKGQDAAAAAGQTARVFLGLSIQCAQCHDHPYDPTFKRDDFNRFAAYFAEVRVRRDKAEPGSPPRFSVDDRTLPEVLTSDGPRGERARRKAAERAAAKGREVPPWLVVEPRFLGRDVSPLAGETRRQTLARAIVASPLFARAAVNRTWALFFGAGVIDPWDDLGGEAEAPPPVLAALSADFVASGYDLRALCRALVLSDAYQRSSAGVADQNRARAAETLFARARVRPMSADQLFGALVTVTGLEQAERGRFRAVVAQGKQRVLREFLSVFPDDEMSERDDFSGSVAQMLLVLNGEISSYGSLAVPGGTLDRVLGESPDAEARLESLFLAAYARPPRPAEAAPLLAYVRSQGGQPAAWEDVFFALITSSEFTTNH
jgi:hypothetical protein